MTQHEQDQEHEGRTEKSALLAPNQLLEPEPKGEGPVRVVTIIEESRSGFTRARIVTVDERIIVDEYDGPHAKALWYCDNCGKRHRVTAQFRIGDGGNFLTLCENCCQNAINGIRYSYAHPVTPDGAK